MKFERVCIEDWPKNKVHKPVVKRGEVYITSDTMLTTNKRDPLICMLIPEGDADPLWRIPARVFSGAVRVEEIEPSWEAKYRLQCVRTNTLREKMRLVERAVDKLRNATYRAAKRDYHLLLLEMFDPETGKIKEITEL